MAVKATFVLLLLGIAGILEVQAASIATENDMWKNLDEEENKRGVEVDDIDPAEYLPTDDKAYEHLASDVADGFDYYRDAIESRAAVCQDVFAALCKRLGRDELQCTARRNVRFAQRYCPGSCPQFCQ